MLVRNKPIFNREVFRQIMYFCMGGLYFMIASPFTPEIQAQRIDFTYKTYGLEIDGDNVIQNAAHLEGFFEKLYQLQLSNDRKVNIVHIGDSHIQADYMTSIIRRNFHRHFGNAGRGLIVPLHVAHTNEPNNFKTASNASWNSKRCVFPEQPLPIGIGGVTIETTNPEANLEIYMNDLWLDYNFNTLTLFYEKDAKSFDFLVRDIHGKELGRMDYFTQDSSRNFSRITWEKKIDAISIQTVKTNPDQSRAIVYGAVLENSLNGVLYHTIGVNGAKFKHYNEAKRFAAQTAGLHTDLFIISLGTNESIDYPYLEKTFPEQVDKLLSKLREINPLAEFILVTPQDVFRRKNKPNPGILQVREKIIQYAVENGFAFYDLYRAMGGEHSAKSWSQHALLGGDGIHLTKDGYEYQGNLFYHALMKGYNSYVPGRHP
jgi:lysophospholipase L1-like esterase